MKILYATDVFEGSPLIHTFEICKNLTELGDNIDLVINLPEEKLKNFKDLKNCKIHSTVDVQVPRSYRVSILKPLVQDVTLLLKSRKIKHYDLIYTRNPLLALQLKIFNRNSPVVWEVNGLDSAEFQVGGENHPIKVWLVRAFEEKLLPMILDKIIVVTPPIKEVMVKGGADKNKIEVIRNGTDYTKFNPSVSGTFVRKKYNIDADAKLIIFAGTIRPWHGMNHIINIFSKVIQEKDAKLLIVGTGKKELLQQYKQLASDLGLEKNLIWTGWVNSEDMPNFIAAADLGIHTMIYPIDMDPFKVLEYMASGKPVIGSIYGLRDLLERSKGGLIIDPLKYEESADRIIELLNNEDTMKQMGKNAREHIIENHDWQKNMKKLHDILNAMLQEKKSM